MQLQLANPREKNQVSKERIAQDQSDMKEKKPSYLENKGHSQHGVNGDMATKASKNGNFVVMNQAKEVIIPNVIIYGVVILTLLCDIPTKVKNNF